MASTPMRMTQQKSKAQVEPPQEPTGEGALVEAMSGADAVVEMTVRIAKTKLQCPNCTLPLKPPIFQCVVGHLACGACHPKLMSSGRCYQCGHSGGYARNSAVEGIVSSAKVPCPHDAYGCRTYVTYYDAAEHQRACPHAPCLCAEPGCRRRSATTSRARTRSPWTGSGTATSCSSACRSRTRRTTGACWPRATTSFSWLWARSATRRLASSRSCAPAVRLHDPRGARGGERGPADGARAEQRRPRRDDDGGGGVAGGAAPGAACGGSRGDAFLRPHRQDRVAAGDLHQPRPPDSNWTLTERHDSSPIMLTRCRPWLLEIVASSSGNELVSRVIRDCCWEMTNGW